MPVVAQPDAKRGVGGAGSAQPDILKTSDGEALLKAAIGLGLEGVVSKKRGSPYRSGPCRDWVKVKSAIWREANRERWSLLQRQG